MPYGNRMGPDGLGPGTGRRLGYCEGYDHPACCRNSGFGSMGRGRRFAAAGRGIMTGRGRGGGQRFFYSEGSAGGFYPGRNAGNSLNEMDFLKEQAGNLENELASVQARIKIVEESQKETE